MAHFACANEVEVLDNIRKLIYYLPLNNLDDPPVCEQSSSSNIAQEELDALVPENPNKPYNMHGVINIISDKDSFFEVHSKFAENIIVPKPKKYCGCPRSLKKYGGRPKTA